MFKESQKQQKQTTFETRFKCSSDKVKNYNKSVVINSAIEPKHSRRQQNNRPH